MTEQKRRDDDDDRRAWFRRAKEAKEGHEAYDARSERYNTQRKWIIVVMLLMAIGLWTYLGFLFFGPHHTDPFDGNCRAKGGVVVYDSNDHHLCAKGLITP